MLLPDFSTIILPPPAPPLTPERLAREFSSALFHRTPHVWDKRQERHPRQEPLPQFRQQWREHLGRWIPVNIIPPGPVSHYYSDPPQFEPLPGETLSTPAFPAEEFLAGNPKAGGLASEPIDVVIPLADANRGIPHADAELRYCLRSIEKHLDGLGRVWIVGRLPDWVVADGESLIHLSVPDVCPIKDVSIIHKIVAACVDTGAGTGADGDRNRPKLSERFVFFSDDQILLRPLVWQQFGPYHRGDLAGRTRWPTGWWRRMERTREYLRANGRTTLHGDTHAPLAMVRSEVLRVFGQTDWRRPPGLCVGTLYLNWAAAEKGGVEKSKPLGDRKATVESELSATEIRQRIAGRWFLGHNDSGFTGELRAVLDEMFSEASRWEKREGEDGGDGHRASALTSIHVKPAGPTLSIIIPTIGRPTLRRTLESIKAQRLVDGDEVILVQDGPEEESVGVVFKEVGLPGKCVGLERHCGDIGATPRNRGMEIAGREYLVFSDDDDVYRPGAFDSIRCEAIKHPNRPLMFRNYVTVWGKVRWEDKTVRAHNVGTPMFVVPNVRWGLARWPSHRGNDFGFIFETIRKWPDGAVAWCPEILQDYLTPHSTKQRPMVRNLLYHVYPVASNEEWRLNVERLLKYWDVFNGRKIIGVVQDGRTVPLGDVQSAFSDSGIEWLIADNDPQLGERVTFSAGLQRLRSFNPDEATFYAHAKGVINSCGFGRLKNPRDAEQVIPSVRNWRNLMYDHCLTASNLDYLLRRYSVCGCFRIDGDVGKAHASPGDTPCRWFFAGTFYWINHMAYFGHHHPVPLRRNRWAAEYHCGSMFPKPETYCFLDCPPRFRYKFYGMTDEQWAEVAVPAT